MYGLASRLGDVVTIATLWKDLGSQGQLAVPAIAVRVRDGRGETTTIEHNVLMTALERARLVGGSSLSVMAGDQDGRVVRIRDGEGRLVVFDVG